MKIELIKSENILDNSVNLLFGGDFCPRNHYEEKLLRDEPIFSEPIMHEFSNKDWLTVNLETPLWNCDGGNGGLKCDPKVATKLRNLNIDMVSFANNHALDRGDNGMRQTLRLLKDNGIVYGGAGENRQEASKLNIIEQNGLKIGIWCIAEKEYNIAPPESYGTAYFLPEANVLTIAEHRSQVDFLIVFVHAGHEFMMTPSPRIRDAYRSFVNAGADLVIGHHPHVLQGVEYYQGKMICYSLGNFSFGANRNPADKNTAVFQQTFTFVDGQLTDVLDAKIIPTRLSGQDDSNNYQPVIATGAKAQKILQNMREYSASLSEISIDEEGNITIN